MITQSITDIELDDKFASDYLSKCPIQVAGWMHEYDLHVRDCIQRAALRLVVRGNPAGAALLTLLLKSG